MAYLSIYGVDVRAGGAEEAERTTHAGILYQQQVCTCWTEVHPSPSNRSTIHLPLLSIVEEREQNCQEAYLK